MLYKLENGKTITIPNNEIKNYIEKLGINQIDAVELWLTDNGYYTNEEQKKLDDKAKQTKSDYVTSATKKKNSKPKTVKISNEKKQVYHTIYTALLGAFGSKSVEVVKEYKLFSVKIGEKTFKIDVVENRPPKKA